MSQNSADFCFLFFFSLVCSRFRECRGNAGGSWWSFFRTVLITGLLCLPFLLSWRLSFTIQLVPRLSFGVECDWLQTGRMKEDCSYDVYHTTKYVQAHPSLLPPSCSWQQSELTVNSWISAVASLVRAHTTFLIHPTTYWLTCLNSAEIRFWISAWFFQCKVEDSPSSLPHTGPLECR